MITVADISNWMERLAPLSLAESWDNTGLLLGCESREASRIQCCLTLTPNSVEEAIEQNANLVIAHHPLPFRPISKITSSTTAGKMLWDLARQGCAIYAPHTAWDSAENGINALLARRLAVANCQPLQPCSDPAFPKLGAGRIGDLPTESSMEAVVSSLSDLPGIRARGVRCTKAIKRVAFACGSGGSLLGDAIQQGCDLFVTGEATFHTCLEAEAAEVGLLMLGHYASERFSIEHLAKELQREFSSISVWASRSEQDPIVVL